MSDYAKHFLFFILTIPLTSCGPEKLQQTPGVSQTQSIHDGHPTPSKGPWFEGWYQRITTENNESLAVIIATQLRKHESTDGDGFSPGYIAVIRSRNHDLKPQVWEAFPMQTRILNADGTAIASNPDPFSPVSFRWEAKGFGSVDNRQISLRIPQSELEIQVDFDSYKKFEGWNPEGLISLVKEVPLHWYVQDTNMPVNFQLSTKDHHWQDSGKAHWEKNWGKTFPSSWVWGQATGDDWQLVLSHVPLPIIGSLSTPPVSLVGVYIGDRFWQFSMVQNPTTRFEVERKPCKASLKIVASNLTHRLILSGMAAKQSFSQIHTAVPEGFTPNALESFSTTYRIQIQKRTLSGWTTIISRQGEGGALEFGGSWRCQLPA